MANYTAVAAGGDWNVSTTWSPAGVPGALDTAILNSASGNVTVPAAGSTCATLTINGYLGTLLLNGNLTIATSGLNLGSFTGTINFNAGDIILPDGLFNLGNASVYTTLGTGGVRITKPSASFSIFNTNNKIWNCKFALAATGSTSPTIYFEDNPLEVTGLVSFQATTTGTYNLISADIFTPNLVFLKMSGDFTISGSTIYTTSTSGQNIGFTGSANQTLTASGTHQLRCPIRINKTGGVLSLSGTLNYNTGTLAYVASGGTVNAGSSTLFIGASTTLDTNGITWNNVSLNNGTITLTLTSDFNISGTFTASGLSGALTLTFAGVGQFLPTGAFVTNDAAVSTGGVLNITITLPNNISISSFTYTDNSGAAHRRNVTLNGNKNITVSSNIYLGATRGSTISGTSTLIANGSGNITCGIVAGAVYSAVLSIPLNIVGTYTLVNFPYFTSTTITYTSGTITGAACIFTTCTLNLNSGGLWGTDVNIRGNTTLTSNATFGNLTTSTNNVGFTGAFTINVEGDLAINIATSGANTSIVLNGTGNQSWTHGSAVNLSNNLTINKASGTLTVGSVSLPNVYYLTGTLTYNNIGGTVDAATTLSTLNIGGTTILNTNGINWYRISVNAAATITLTSNLNVTNRATYQNGTITHAGGGLLNLTGELSCGSFTASTNVTFPNADLNITNLLINVSALNFNTTVNNGVNNIYISGNYTLANNNNSAWYGITCSPIIFNGSGTQTWTHTTTGTAFVYHVGKVTINTTGTLVFGSNIFWGGNTFQYIQGIVNQNNKSLYIFQSSSLNLQGTTDNLIIENLDTIAQVTGNITLLSDIYCQNANLKYTTTFGMSGNFKLTCNNLVVAETTLVSTGTFNVPANNIYVNNLTLNGRTAGGAINCTGGKFYVNGNFNANGGTFENNFAYYGSEIILTGSGNFATTYGISNPITFDTSGTIRITSTYFFFGSNEAGTNNPVRMTLKYLRGNIIADKTILYLARAGVNGASVPQLYELINIHKIVFKEVFIASSRSGVPNDIIMNEFFNGSPTVKTKVQAITAGVNYVVNFTDNFEKIAKFVDVSGCTLLKPQQLLLLTNMKKSSTNTRGIRYNNQSPNGIPKGDPSVQNLQTVGQSRTLLLGDPAFVKSI